MNSKRPSRRTESQAWHAYILLCGDGTYYTGATNDLQGRLQKHNNGTGAKYTRGRRPVKLVYWERLRTKRQALSREAKIKKWPRWRKEDLIKGKE